MSGLPTPGLEEGVLTCPCSCASKLWPFLTCSICLEHHVMHIHVYNIIYIYIVILCISPTFLLEVSENYSNAGVESDAYYQ